MKAHIPLSAQQKAEAAKLAADYVAELNERCQFIYFFAAFIALNEKFHFGTARLREFYNTACDVLKDAESYVDRGAGDIVIDQLIRNLTSRNINFEDILDVEVTQVPPEYLSKTKYDKQGYLKEESRHVL